MKIKSLLLFSSALLLLTACNKDDEPTTLSSDASITSFTFNKLVIKVEDGKEKKEDVAFGVSFAITEPETKDGFGTIQNADSLPYKTVVDALRPIPLPSNRSVFYKIAGQEEYATLTHETYLDFSAQTPVYLKSVSPDGENSVQYLLKVKVHKVDPDSVIWRSSTPHFGNGAVSFTKVLELDDKLYYFVTQNGITSVFESAKGETWAELATSLSSSYLKDVILYNKVWYGLDAAGKLLHSPNAIIWTDTSLTLDRFLFVVGDRLLATDGNQVKSVNTTDYSATVVGTLPAGFPSEKLQTLTVQKRTGYAIGYVIGGDEANRHLFYTIDGGETWDDYSTGTGSAPFEARKGASLLAYEDRLWLIGGEEARPIETSASGLSWTIENKQQPQGGAIVLKNQTAVVSKDGSIFVIGEADGIQTVWQGRMNKKDFDIQ